MSDYLRLIRPGLLLFVLFSMTVAAIVSAESPAWIRLGHALVGAGLLIAGASATNQLIERRWDAAMDRTASRPLPSGRMSTRHVAMFAAVVSLSGIVYLAATQSADVPILAAASWLIYALIYTPLKRASVWHIPVGAVAGAIPVLLGAATANATLSPISLAIFGVVFFWQFPHTAAIGWIYREQYADSAMKVAAVADPTGRLAGRLALGGAVGVLLTSLIPATQSMGGWLYVAVALALGLADMVFAARFLGKPTDMSARALWRMSLVHLPVLLASLLLG